jgi:hypothetical protein
MSQRRAPSPVKPPFEIEKIERIDRGRLIAAFDVVMPGVRVINCRYFRSHRGSFVTGPSVRAGYQASGWQTFAAFEAEFAADILDAVEARLAAGEGGEE